MNPTDEPVRYIDRTRDYYRALGYAKDYVWSHYDEVPFAPLAKPLSACRLGLVTTAHPPDRSNQDSKGIRRVWSGEVNPPPASLNTDNLAWDRESTHTEDRESFMPIQAAQRLAEQGLIAGLSARFHGVPTEYSQRKTLEVDAPNVLRRLQEDGTDIALLCAL